MSDIRVTCSAADRLPIDSLIEFQGGLKKISRENLDKLKRSILRHGFSAPIFVWHGVDYHILDGHQRLKALLEMREEGYDIPMLPVAYIGADSEKHAKEKLLYITSQYGEFNSEGITDFITELEMDFADIRLADGEFQFSFAEGSEETTGDDDVPDVEDEADSKPGEIYELGVHRLMCGDATDGEQVEKLLNGVKPHLMVTDPPYGVNYKPEWRAKAGVNNNKGKMGKVHNDDNADWRDAWILFPGDVAYVWHAGAKAHIVAESLESCGFSIRSQIIWAKDRFSLSRGNYHWQHEPCWYAVKGKSYFQGDRKQSTLWQVPTREDSGIGHSTQKPVECMRRPIVNNSAPGQPVYDPFLGSGTTIIAAAKEGRICYGMELSPEYCDVIRRRWTAWARENGYDVGGGVLEPTKVASE